MPTSAKVVEHTAAAAGLADQVRDSTQMWKAFQARMRLGMLYKAAQRTPGLSMALGAIEGSAKSIDDIHNGQREAWMKSMGFEPTSLSETLGVDALRTAENIGNALTFNQANRLGDGLSRFIIR